MPYFSTPKAIIMSPRLGKSKKANSFIIKKMNIAIEKLLALKMQQSYRHMAVESP